MTIATEKATIKLNDEEREELHLALMPLGWKTGGWEDFWERRDARLMKQAAEALLRFAAVMEATKTRVLDLRVDPVLIEIEEHWGDAIKEDQHNAGDVAYDEARVAGVQALRKRVAEAAEA